jgi:hypothetical protein
MSRDTKAAFIMQYRGRFLLKTDWVDAFGPALKAKIPRGGREWDPQLGVWIIEPAWEADMRHVIDEFYDLSLESSVDAVGAPQEEVKKIPDWDRRKLYVTDDAPAEVVDAAYKALVKVHHPDKGGSADRMSEINVAYDKVRSKR